MSWQETKTLRHGAATIIIHRPQLTDTERAKREKAIKETMARTMKSYATRKENTA